MSTEARAKPKASTTGRRAQGGFDRAGAALEPSRLAISLAHQQALQSGSELVRQQLGSTALADASRGEVAKAMAREMNLATIKPQGSQIAEQIAADRERRERIAEVSTASFRRMAESCAPRIAPMEIGLGLNAIAALGSIGNLAAVTPLADQHVPVRIPADPACRRRTSFAHQSRQVGLKTASRTKEAGGFWSS
jgi:hypothetical protein